jgi:uncharacterized membrane protein
MKNVAFPHPFKHEHPQIKNVNELFEEKLTPGQRSADRVAQIMGSWKFVLIQTFLLFIWAVLNTVAWIHHWDPYPFILMNLVLSLQAAYTAPVIMMSQNRLADKDRIDAHNDYLTNIKAEEEVRAILEHLHAQDEALLVILDRISKNENKQS